MSLTAMFVVSFLLSGSHAAGSQDKPDFSGTWKLVEYRIGNKVRSAQGGMVGGAAVNCGQQCTITQTADTLTVSRTAPQGGAKPRDEVVFLDGRPTTNQTTVTWDGTKLSLVRSFANIVVTQTIAREKDRLTIVATLNTGNVGPYTLTYERSSGSR